MYARYVHYYIVLIDNPIKKRLIHFRTPEIQAGRMPHSENMFFFISSVGDKHCEWLKQLGKGIGSVFEFLNVTAIQESTQEGTQMTQCSILCCSIWDSVQQNHPSPVIMCIILLL